MTSGRCLCLCKRAMASAGARIRSLRLRFDRSEQSFAAMLGVAPDAVRMWERGEGVDRDALILIAAVTDTAMQWLIAGLGPPQVDAIREAVLPGRVPPAAGGISLRDRNRIRSNRVMTDGAPPPSLAPVWDVQPERTAEARRPSALLLDLRGATVLAGSRATTYRVTGRRPAKGGAGFHLGLTLRGLHRFEGLGRDCEAPKGCAFFTSSADGGIARYDPDGRYLGLFVPAAPLLARVPNAETRLMRPIAPDEPALRLIRSYACGLVRSGTGADGDLAPSCAQHLADLCALLLGAEGEEKNLAERRGLRAAQRSAAARAIRAGAAAPGFSPAAVAGELGVTERHVHDLFTDTGDWFWDRVNARRIEVARARLDDPRFDRMTVAEIAFACGFSDLGQFQRLFRERFGEAQDVRRRSSQ